MLAAYAEPVGHLGNKSQGLGILVSGRRARLGDQQSSVLPNRNSVGPEMTRDRPARKLLAGIPLPLRVPKHAARRESSTQPACKGIGQTELGAP